MDALEERAGSMDVSEIVDTLNAAGKLAGVAIQGSGGNTLNVSLGHLHLGAIKSANAQAKLITEGTSTSYSSTPGTTEDANVIDDNGLGHS